MRDEELTAAELAQHFNEQVPEVKIEAYPDETLYAIVARMRNLVGFAVNSNPTGVGIQLCNAYTHVLKSLYDFAHTLPEADRVRMSELIRKNEGFPADFISSVHAGLVEAKIANDRTRAELARSQELIVRLNEAIINLRGEVTELSKPFNLWHWILSKFV